jgi:ubiquinone/menaquinone biosynthesis C-methylase UbiE
MDDERYYLSLAAAFVKGRRSDIDPALPPAELFRAGEQAGLKLHKFKRTMGLPRVKRVLGVLAGLRPASLLDIGSGRGAFLWPLLDAFPALRVVAVDESSQRAGDIQAVGRGGVTRLSGLRMDARRLAFADDSFEVATMLEVVEHIPEPQRVFDEAVRVARRFVIASVPSHEDDNPEHIHLFDEAALSGHFAAAGAARVTFERVLNHIIAVARL